MKLDTKTEAEKAAKERAEDEWYYAIELKEEGKVIGELFGHPESADPELDSEYLDTFSPC